MFRRKQKKEKEVMFLAEFIGVIEKISNKNNSVLVKDLKKGEKIWVSLDFLGDDSKNYRIGEIVLVTLSRRKLKEFRKLYSQASGVREEEIQQSPEEIMFDCLRKVNDIFVYGELDKEFKRRIDWTKIVVTLAIMKTPQKKVYK